MKLFLSMISIVLLSSAACADGTLKVVATLSTFADLAGSIGGEHVEVSTVGSPRFNPHFIEPKPSDVLRLKRADLYLHSGLDLEAWSGPLVDAAARADFRKNGERQVDLSQGITLLNVPAGQVSRAEGDIHLYGNPHYWLDPRNGITMAQTIAAKLSFVDPSHAEQYRTNLDTFVRTIRSKISDWENQLRPLRGEKLIGYHDEWAYLMHFSGLEMERFLEPKPGIPPSPGHIASLIAYANTEGIKAIVQPTYYPRDAAEEVAAHSKARVVTACQNVRELPEASSYIAMLDLTIRAIVGALSHA